MFGDQTCWCWTEWPNGIKHVWTNKMFYNAYSNLRCRSNFIIKQGVQTDGKMLGPWTKFDSRVQRTELIIVNGSFCNLRLLGWRYISSLHSAVAILLYRFWSRWCLETFFMLYQPCSLLSLYIFLAHQISCRSSVGSAYRMRSFAVSHSSDPTAALITKHFPFGQDGKRK